MQTFLTDKNGIIFGTLGSSYAGAAAALALDCGREVLRKKVTGLSPKDKMSPSERFFLFQTGRFCILF